ncbi:CO dehydrogenase accessory protein CooT [Neomoorella glycerini]|uniref:CO dehydrogenase accessory protein CooT n=1 Tax=Neomoorella glycerini TaxID=55779 RepID=A0A6I5ZMJ4_9FIRM|nr:CooT family nickel-binding protein [Moorella glycerini]QGP90787.1 CO dehydrogenase accessory protein CooT [Moorella glycerini]
MCEANAYLLKENGEEELVFENVDRVLPREDGILMEDIFGKKKILRARIKEMALVDHKIFLEAI